MISETVTYKDFDDNQRTKTVYFHLSRMEAIDLEVLADKPISQLLTEVVETKDPREIIKTIKMLVLKAYGVKSADGSEFEKSDELTAKFEKSPVFDQLFFDLMTDAEKAAAFVKGIIPKGIPEAAKPQDHKQKAVETKVLPEPQVVTPEPYTPKGFEHQDFSD